MRKGDTVKVEFTGKIVYVNHDGEEDETFEVEPSDSGKDDTYEYSIDYIPGKFLTVTQSALKDGDVIIDDDGDLLHFKTGAYGERGFARNVNQGIIYLEEHVKVAKVIGNTKEN